MSTRGVIGLRYNGVDKISYNHFDSYLSQLGLHFLKALRGRNRQDLVEAYARMQLVGNETLPTPEQVENCRRYVEIPAASGATDSWFTLLRNAQGRADLWFSGLPFMVSAGDFLKDSLFCEWAYLLNLDEDVVEIYRGHNKDPDAPGRYAALPEDAAYKGVALVKRIPLTDVLEGRFGEAELLAFDKQLHPEVRGGRSTGV